MNRRYKILSAFCCASLFLWVACNNFVEWRGGGFPKLVMGKSKPNINKLRQQREEDLKTNPDKDAEKDTNATVANTDLTVGFRGTNGDGVYKNESILTDWPEEGPPVLWRKLIGGGHSSFAISGNLAFTIEQQENNEVVFAFSTQTGRAQWSFEYSAKFEEYFGGIGPRSTPAWDEGRLYSLGAKGHLHCLDANTGKLIWAKNLMTENKAEIPYWGVSASPFIYKNTVILTPGGENDDAIVALDKESGKKVWSALNGVQTYSTPVLLELLGKEQLLVSLKDKVVAINPNDGTLLWSHPWKIFMNNNNIAQPTRLADDVVLISAGYGTGAEAFQIVSKDNDMSTESLWKSKSLKTKFSSPVLWKGHLYGLNDNRLVCLDAKNGSLKWRGDKFGYGQIIAASGHLIVLGDDGDLALVEMNPDQFVQKAKFKALKGGRTWNYPALSQGLLFVRNSYEMACYDLRVK